ncbi:MAG TPA: methionine--tRNA ligase [Candidatus Dormibacteraeota bacterium]|nr:methionine--tRNA ligase [Candidatus Dormibacteraeota bacterium]
MQRPFYVTTPIYYISGNPHIGHAYTTVIADVLARAARTERETFFLTGTDEHGQKVANAAAAAGKSPQDWCDALAPRWQELFATFNVAYDDFIRTTQPRHERVVQRVFERLRESGDIYLGTYEGWYCVEDETFWLESKLVEKKCPTCGREVSWLSEQDWFFRLSAYRDRLLEHYRAHPTWLRPKSVYNEMISLLEEGLDDFSISRTNFDWGIEIPGGGGVIYVWFDALLNYISALEYGTAGGPFERFWPANVQLIGKEIARFHTIVWPAVLWALGEAAPETIFAHGWITVDGRKMGKSLGNATDPFALAERFGADTLRYFLLREAPFGSDFSYSDEKIVARNNDDLGNDLGNLVRRSLAMLAKYCDGVVPAPGEHFVGAHFAALPGTVADAIFDLRFRDALESIWQLVGALNRSIDERKPWVLWKERENPDSLLSLHALMYELCEGVRWLASLLAPFMPQKAAEIAAQLGLPGGSHERTLRALHWGELPAGTKTHPGEVLFARIEVAQPSSA